MMPGQGQTKCVAFEFQHFALLHVIQTMHAHDAVGHRNHGAFGTRLRGQLQVLDPALDQVADFRRIEVHQKTPSSVAQ
jgi:hypothetical protein